MVQGLMAFTVAALMALVAVSGSQDRPPLHVTSDAAAQQQVDYDQLVY
ncbi:hypothetical protein BC777_1397 [Yoonia maricola]|uniref:Uncharacterized protein n=1 Tax=Yoonia maricola TaxID=420999 RepID=A0A2M8WNP3_9RHOB|nr:hypothetical protein [Yoonia maricola]PJI92544.1 hypothetical protein BC777_1397 [Yoonia maricola]